MKKSVAVCLISGFVLIAIGIITVIISASMGVAGQIRDSFNDASPGNYEAVYNEFVDVKSIDFEINRANLEVSEGDVFSIKYQKHSNSDFECYIDEDGEWHISGSVRSKRLSLYNIISWFENGEKDTIYITIPAGTELSDFDLEVNAGNVEWKDITAGDFDIDVNAGNIELYGVNIIGKMEISCSAGNVEVDNASVSDLYISLSAGNVDWSGDARGNINADSNMGNVTIRLSGDVDDYNYDVNSNMGSVTLNGKEYEGWSETINIQNGAEKNIILSSNMGNIDVIIK